MPIVKIRRRSFGLRSKLVLFALLIAITSLLVSWFVASRISGAALRHSSFGRLTAVRELKAEELETYFSIMRSQLMSLARNPLIARQITELETAFASINKNPLYATVAQEDFNQLRSFYSEQYISRLDTLTPNMPSFESVWPENPRTLLLQHQYIAANPHDVGSKHLLSTVQDGTRYDAIHSEIHPYLLSIQQEFGFYDIFLIDMSGTVIYSVFKETDFATSLISGPYSDSNLATVTLSAMNSDFRTAPFIVDYAPYLPSYGAQAAFMAAPVFLGEAVVGAVAVQLPSSRIDSLMTNFGSWSDVGLGQTGETYVVGSDLLIRNESRFFIEDKTSFLEGISKAGAHQKNIAEIERFGSVIGRLEVRTDPALAAVSGVTGESVANDYRDVRVFSSYRQLEIPGLDWAILSEIDETEALAGVRASAIALGRTHAVLAICFAAVAVLLSVTLTRPISALTNAARRLGHGELDIDLDASAKRNDEVGELSQAFASMRNSISEKIRTLESKNIEVADAYAIIQQQQLRLESELSAANEIQQSMLPKVSPSFSDQKEFEIYAMLESARQVGGDFFDFFFIDNYRVCICIGDVSDKGVPAALFMAVTKTLIKSYVMEMGTPSQVISRVNCDLARDNGTSMFATVFLCVVDLKTNIATYTNAGHNPPFLRSADGSVKRLDTRHGPFAAIAEEHQYGESQIQLHPSDLLLLFTDGVTEAMNEKNQLFTDDALKDVVLNYSGTSCAGLVNQILSRVRDFEGKAEPSDDLTMLAFRLREVSGEDYGKEVLTAKLRGELSEVASLIASFDAAAQQFGVSNKVRKQLSVVFDELLSNIICHGFIDEEAHSIEVKVSVQDEMLQVTLKDDGLPFDPFQHETPDLTLPLEERTTGGLGIHIVRSFVDNSDYLRKDDMNIVTFFKSFVSCEV